MTITKFTIFGERNSGTKYLQQMMLHNFDLKLTWQYGGKHWYIKDHHPRGRANIATDALDQTSIQNSSDTLVIFIVRNPIDWLRSMHNKPYHAENVAADFSEFIRRLWISSWRVDFGRVKAPVCYDQTFEDQVVVPTDFIEEAENICVLRNMKNKHFLGLGDVCKNFHIIRQETLREDLEELSLKFKLGVSPIELFQYSIPKSYPAVSSQDLKFIRESLDLNIEKQLGYKI